MAELDTTVNVNDDAEVDAKLLEELVEKQLKHTKSHNASRNEKKRQRQKQKKQEHSHEDHTRKPHTEAGTGSKRSGFQDVVLEYVTPDVTEILPVNDPTYSQFVDVFNHFQTLGARHTSATDAQKDETSATADDESKDDGLGGRFKTSTDEMSKKARKKLLQFAVAELKQKVEHPEVVEAHDVSASDPKLLIYLKSYKNTVPVPRHWSAKSKYLQRKVGIEKPPFQLPHFIEATGISRMRGPDQDSDKTLKSKQRDRYLPKMGRIEIDYQILHDAIFVHQTKPKLSKFGELYYQGKEFEAKFNFKPGQLSDKLRTALGLADGAPPPWLFKMQQYGPPPAYPSLKIPGVNAPLPPGATYGNHPGGWGQPPVDEYGRPLYGDVFGTGGGDGGYDAYAPRGPKIRWGELSSVDMSAAALSLQETAPPPPAEAQAEGDAAAAGGEAPVLPADGDVSVAPSEISEAPDMLDIRKGLRKSGTESEIPDTHTGPAPALYQVLEEKRTALSGGLLGTSHAYVLPGAQQTGTGVAVNLTPEELERLDERTIATKFEQGVRDAAAQRNSAHEEIADVIEEQERKRKRKDAGLQDGGGNKAKRAKEFKF